MMDEMLRQKLLKTKTAAEFRHISRESGGATFNELGEEVTRHFFDMLPHTNTSTEEEDPGGFSDPIVKIIR